MALTSKQVVNAKEGKHSDGRGLMLVVRQGVTGLSRAWVFRYQVKGQRRDMGLGSAEVISLKQARALTEEKRALLARGIDPVEHREQLINVRSAAADKARTQGTTFREVAKRYIQTHRAGWRNAKHADQWANTLDTYAYPILGNMPVSAIGIEHVLKVLKPIWTKKTETATRVRSRIESILDAATAEKLRSSENPARWRGNLAALLPPPRKVKPQKHFAALPIDDLPEFMTELRATRGVSALCLEFAILTAARSGEARKACWSEIDKKNALWVIPADRMKARREHRVPLSGAALNVLGKAKELLRKLDRNGAPENDLIFPGERSGIEMSDMSLLMVLRRHRPGFTAHGFRSAFRDWVAERTTYQGELAEHALAHVIGNKTEAAYRRGDQLEKRRQMMDDWAAFCSGQRSKVVPIRRRKMSS